MDPLRILELILVGVGGITGTGYLLIKSQKKQLNAEADRYITESVQNLIPPLNARIDQLELTISRLESEVQDKGKRIVELEREMLLKDERIKKLEQLLEEWQRRVRELERENHELKNSGKKLL